MRTCVAQMNAPLNARCADLFSRFVRFLIILSSCQTLYAIRGRAHIHAAECMRAEMTRIRAETQHDMAVRSGLLCADDVQ